MKPKTIQLLFDLASFCYHGIYELMPQSVYERNDRIV